MTRTIRPATTADAERLSQLGAMTFRETFERDNTPDDMARYLAGSFSPQKQMAEITDPASVVLLAQHETPTGEVELIGYAHLVSGPAPAAVGGAAPIEIKRLYVARAWHGRGIAQLLMDAALESARSRGARTVWLGVWERNARAAAFYGKYGFERVGEQTFLLGRDVQTDWLLTRSLDDHRAAAAAAE